MKKELEIYELILLLNPSLMEAELNKRVSYYQQLITEKGSQVRTKNHGKKSLAYPIKNCETAISLQFIYPGNGNLVQQLNTEIQRDESVLRATTTKLLYQNEAPIYDQLLQT
jgi:ribosomal protein S6